MDKGIGYDNVKKRLELLYNKNYTLSAKRVDDTYFTYLKIPLQCKSLNVL